MNWKKLALLFFVPFALGGAIVTADVYEIDPVHSNVGFRVRHIVAMVEGRFDEFSGTIRFDEKKPADLKADVVIKTASVSTNNPKRDNHLRTADFFHVDKHPTMNFKTTKVVPAGQDKFQITGDLTLLGVTKPVVLEAELLGTGADPQGNTRIGFSATGKLNRKDYGMVFNIPIDKGGLVLGDEVQLKIDVAAVKKK